MESMMRFMHRSREVDTADMKAFETGHPFTPQIFLDREQECFVAQHRAGWTEPKMRYVPRHEARRLADLYHLEDLKSALHEKSTPHMVYQDAASGKSYDTRSMRRVDVAGQDGAIYVADDGRCFSADGQDTELKELSKEEAEKLAEIFGRADLKDLLGRY
jgi:hypothetical protein